MKHYVMLGGRGTPPGIRCSHSPREEKGSRRDLGPVPAPELEGGQGIGLCGCRFRSEPGTFLQLWGLSYQLLSLKLRLATVW